MWPGASARGRGMAPTLLAATVTLAGGARTAANAPDGGSVARFTSYLQVRGTAQEGGGTSVALRRLKVFGGGPVGNQGAYYLQLLYKDGNRSATDGKLFLQEAWLKHSMAGGSLTFGQFKPPFGLERFISDAVLPLIDRSQVTDRLVPNGSLGDSFTRDLGLQWDSTLGSIGYSAGVFLGRGANEALGRLGPLAVLRLQWEAAPARGVGSPPTPASPRRLRLVTAVSWRRASALDLSGQLPGSGSLGYRRFTGHDLRETVGLEWQRSRTTIQGEGFLAQYHASQAGMPSASAREGYLEAIYHWSRAGEAALRYEAFDPGLPGDLSSPQSAWTLGGTCRLRGDREKLQVNYVRQKVGVSQGSRGLWLLQYQQYLSG